MRSVTGRESLLGSAFHLSAGGGDAGGPGYAAWGRVTAGGFDGEELSGAVTTRIDGEVTTGILGADMAWERWLAGLAVSVSEGEGTFGRSGGMADGEAHGGTDAHETVRDADPSAQGGRVNAGAK